MQTGYQHMEQLWDACTGSHEYDQLAINLLRIKSIKIANDITNIAITFLLINFLSKDFIIK